MKNGKTNNNATKGTKGTNQNTKHQINHYTYYALIRQPGELGYHNNNNNNKAPPHPGSLAV